MSARTAGRDARVLDLDRDLAPVVQRRAVDLADRGGRDRLLVEASRRPRRAARPSSDSITLRMSAKRTFGAASRSSPSLRWNSSRYSSGTRPTSRNESTWPSFIAAPFIVPSAVTICSAASRWRRSSASRLPCSPRRQVRRLRAELARALAGGEPRDAGGARDARGGDAVLRHRRDGVRAWASGSARAGADCGATLGAGVAVGVGVGVGVALGVGVGVGVRFAASSGVFVGVGVCFSSLAVAPRAAVEERGRVAVVAADALAGEQLRAGDEDHGADEGEDAGGEREPPLPRRELAARRVDGALRRPRAQLRDVLGRGRRERVERPRAAPARAGRAALAATASTSCAWRRRRRSRRDA